MNRRTTVTLVLAVVVSTACTSPAGARRPDVSPPTRTQAPPGSAGIGDGYFPLDGNGGIDVLHYDVRVAYDFAKGRLSGVTRVKVRADADLSRFNLDLLLPVTQVSLDGTAAEFDQVRGHELRITPVQPLSAGQVAHLRVAYSGRPGRQAYAGESNWVADSGELIIANQPHMAPWWFPANDHPQDKATMDLHFTAPRGMKVISNGIRVGRRVHGQRATTHWSTEEPMAAYLAFVAAGKFVVRTGRASGLPYVVAVSRRLTGQDRQRSLEQVLRSAGITAWLAAELVPYPFTSTGGVVTGLNLGFALENQTRPVYPPGKSVDTGLIVHELAHQWFGNSVSVERWRDIWLNEGFATFMEWRYSETHGGITAEQNLRGRYEAAAADDRYWDLRVGDPGARDLFADQVYNRGAMTLQALRNRIGEEDFWTLLRTWLTDREGAVGSGSDFEALAETVSGEDLDGFFEAWLREQTRPAATAENGLA